MKTVPLRTLPVGARFRLPEVNLEGTLIRVGPMGAEVSWNRAAKRVEIRDPDSGEMMATFESKGRSEIISAEAAAIELVNVEEVLG